MFHLLISNQPGPCSEADEKKKKNKREKQVLFLLQMTLYPMIISITYDNDKNNHF